MAQAEPDGTSSKALSTRTPLEALKERLPSEADVHVVSGTEVVVIDPAPDAAHEDAATITLESDGCVYTDGFPVEYYSGRPSLSSTTPDQRDVMPTPVAAFKKAAEHASIDERE